MSFNAMISPFLSQPSNLTRVISFFLFSFFPFFLFFPLFFSHIFVPLSLSLSLSTIKEKTSLLSRDTLSSGCDAPFVQSTFSFINHSFLLFS